ncbi:MAG: translation initiation factor [Bacteroidia bacterium]
MNNNKRKTDGIVYSTDSDFKFSVQETEENESLKPGAMQLKIFLDRLGGGKMVSRVTGFEGNEKNKEELATSLKKHCGVGGSVKGNEILIQGNHREKLVAFLSKKGFKVKIAGG